MLHKTYGENLVTICKSKVIVTLNKRACIGMCILELNKVFMYEFHYDYIKNKYGNNSRLSFTDSDCLICHILGRIRKCLILVIIQLSENIMMIQAR